MTLRLLQSLPKMSLAISIVVVICMAISFAALFFLYGRTKAKGVDFGVEDKPIKSELTSKLKKRENNTTYTQMLADGRKKERIIRIVTDAVLLILVILVGALTIFSFVLRGKGEQIYFGDTAYLTVLTSSMQEKNENNPYLRENDDGVRIHQYALIGIDKVDPAELKVGDIIAFKYEGNTIYVHRIVAVREAGENRFFTTMGDANDISSPNETNISADRIVGVFNGYHKGFLGVLLIYMRSDIGMVALLFVFLLLAVIDAAEWFITRSYEKRQVVLAAEMDGVQETAEPTAEERKISFVAEEEGALSDAETAPAAVKTVYDRSFKARLIASSDEVKALYGKIKNKILSYSKVRSVEGWKHETFMFSNKGKTARLSFRGKTLCVWLPFGAEAYNEAGITVNGSDENCLLRITGNVTLNRAFKAVAVAMEKLGAVAGEEKNEDYYLPYQTEEELISANLIKKKTVDAEALGRLKKTEGENDD